MGVKLGDEPWEKPDLRAGVGWRGIDDHGAAIFHTDATADIFFV